MNDAPELTHEAVARRRNDGFVATCTCGWFGHDVPDRREATRAALGGIGETRTASSHAGSQGW